jgi:hypothetical protein
VETTTGEDSPAEASASEDGPTAETPVAEGPTAGPAGEGTDEASLVVEAPAAFLGAEPPAAADLPTESAQTADVAVDELVGQASPSEWSHEGTASPEGAAAGATESEDVEQVSAEG